ncbi:hypothetical protein BDR26DRAFT_681992 [Obelidium mucronatum]|nr:hypothetical protein BDR26DRAFT_681992 [Obelidium mucronatum]
METRAVDLPGGYSFKSIPGTDWVDRSPVTGLPKIELMDGFLTVESEADCAGQTFARGGFFYEYYTNVRSCYPKMPPPSTFTTLIPTSATTAFELPTRDFAFMFDMPNQHLQGISKSDCSALCWRTPGCAIGSWGPKNECSLKQPDPISNGAGRAGMIFQVPPCVPVNAGVCSASQCSTAIPDGCGGSLNCPACPKIEGPSESAAVTSIAQANATVVVVVTVTNAAVNPAPNTPAKTDVAPSNPNIGLIAGVAGGVVLLLGLAIFAWTRRSRKTDDDMKSVLIMKDLPSKNNDNSNENFDLPQYQYTTSPDPKENLRPVQYFNVTSVPGFYAATVEHHPLKDGQLALTVGMRLYVTSIDQHGWCKALVGKQQGFVHADMLGPIG